MIKENLLRLAQFVYGFNEFSGPPWNTSFPCPTTILARPHRNSDCIAQPDKGYCRFPNMTIAHLALTNCPNVKTLDVYLDDGGCTGPELDRTDFPFAEGEKYPSLKSLVLDGYEFGGMLVRHELKEGRNYGEGREGNSGPCMGPAREEELWDDSHYSSRNAYVDQHNNDWWSQWNLKGGEKPKTNLDMWLQAMDWSHIEELSINTHRTQMVEAITELPQRLTSLKTLYLDSLPFIKNLRKNILEELHWIGETDAEDLHTILSHQGQSLRSLEYRCDEFRCSEWPDYTNTTLLQLLAPNLQRLSVNLPRNGNGTWPLAHLEGLANLPSLSHIDLYFRMQAPCSKHDHSFGFPYPSCGKSYRDVLRCKGNWQFEAPYLNATTASYMFSYLRDNNPSQNISSVTFHTGDWMPPSERPYFVSSFVTDRRNVVYCSVRQGVEYCEAMNDRGLYRRLGLHDGEPESEDYYRGDWEWEDGTYVVGDDIEEFESAEMHGDVLRMDEVRARMEKKLEQYQDGLNA